MEEGDRVNVQVVGVEDDGGEEGLSTVKVRMTSPERVWVEKSTVSWRWS